MTAKRGKAQEEAQAGEGITSEAEEGARQTNCVSSQFILPLMSFVLISF